MKPYLRYLLSTVSTLTPIGASLAQVPATGSWTGPYIGLNIGAARNRAAFDGEFSGITASGKVSTTGATLGGQLGYNWRSQDIDYGIEADLSLMGKKGTASTDNSFGASGSFDSKLSHLVTIRGRVGTLLSPPTLLYGTAGYAAAKVENVVNDNALDRFTDRKTRSGWTIGGGVEHQYTPQWTVKAELLYVDLGTSNVQGRGFGIPGYEGKFKDTAVVGRVGANFRF